MMLALMFLQHDANALAFLHRQPQLVVQCCGRALAARRRYLMGQVRDGLRSICKIVLECGLGGTDAIGHKHTLP